MERLRNFFLPFIQPEYLTSHQVENLQVAALIKIVECTRREHFGGGEEYLKKLRNQFQPDFISQVGERRFVELAKQLYSIEQLGQTQNKEALDYLQFIYLETTKTVKEIPLYLPGSIYVPLESWSTEKHIYRNAKRALRKCLNFDILFMTRFEGVDDRDTRLAEERSQRNPVYLIIEKAIDTLEQTRRGPSSSADEK